MNLYEILGVNTAASPSEIGARYRALKALYEGELATYGLLSEADRDAARSGVEQAYFVLCDAVKRKAYDRELIAAGHAGPWFEFAVSPASASQPIAATTAPTSQAQPKTPTVPPSTPPADKPQVASEPVFTLTPPQAQALDAPAGAFPPEPLEVPVSKPETQAVLRLDPPNDRMDGGYLRAVRELRGVSLEKLSQTLKITQTQLECIETHRFEKLPAPVYLRGFLLSYARFVGIDGNRLVRDYMVIREAWEGGRGH